MLTAVQFFSKNKVKLIYFPKKVLKLVKPSKSSLIPIRCYSTSDAFYFSVSLLIFNCIQ